MKLNISKIKFVFVGIFIVFSLTSCSVKDAFFDGIGVSFFKPLHQNKATLSSTSCTNWATDNLSFQSIHSIEFLDNQSDKFVYWVNTFFIKKSNITNEYFFQNIIQSPPKYILFRCLKISF